jgi:hypothetical protein
MKETKKYMTSIFKKEIETEESIQWRCYEDIFKDGDIYPTEIEFRGESSWGGENYPMKIDDVTKILETLKKEGCNYVEMSYHGDHISYIFNGILVRESTPEEIEKEKMLSELRQEAKKEISIYEKKIRDIKNNYNDLCGEKSF